MAASGDSPLDSDIQRALQHAVVDANNAFSQSDNDNTTKKKKKKKKRLTDVDGSLVEGVPAVKEKKKRTQAAEQEMVEGEDPPPEMAAERPKKKQKSDKGKQLVEQQGMDQQDQDSFQQIDPQLSSSSNQASTSAFLAALVAAASATSDAQPPPSQQGPFPPHQFVPPPYAPYPPMQYGYPHSSNFAQPPPQVPTSMGTQLPELSFGSNEEILRALQDLDVSKIAQVLKSLGEAAASANVPQPFMSQMSIPPPLGQVPTGSGAILGQNDRQGKSSNKRTLDMSLAGPEHGGNPDHAYILANKWMNATKLADMVKTQGLVYKKGKFSAIEEQQVQSAIQNYCLQKQVSDEQLHELVFAKNDKGRDNSFWSEITSAVPLRPIIAVYHHVRRVLHPLKQQGKWAPEEDALLKQAVTDYGQQWERVSTRVGRMSADCRDRYRNHIANREVRVTGHWTKDEEDELTEIVTAMTIKQGKDIDNDVFWGKVSEQMGNRRGRQQCRIKWTDSLSKTVKNEGQKPRWSQQDAYILVHKVDSLNVRDDTEIDWKTLPDSDWNLWSAHSLQRRWLTLKKGIKGFEDMTHQEIMDILRVKKAHFPAPPVQSKKKKVTSAAAVTDSDNGTTPAAEAGSSNGPGTLGAAKATGERRRTADVEDNDSSE